MPMDIPRDSVLWDLLWDSEVRGLWGLDDETKRKLKSRCKQLDSELTVDVDWESSLAVMSTRRHSTRPVAEPPIFNHEMFRRPKMSSDSRYKLLFPDDVVRRTAYKELHSGYQLLMKYQGWIEKQDENTKESDIRFFEGLEEVYIDYKTVSHEVWVLGQKSRACDLEKWEVENLDDGLGTKRIDFALLKQHQIWDVYGKGGKEKWEKDGHLAPPNYAAWIPMSRSPSPAAFITDLEAL